MSSTNFVGRGRGTPTGRVDTEPADDVCRTDSAFPWWGIGSLLGALIVGTIGRLVMLTGAQGEIHADEAVVGLMARALSHGDVQVFYWGQVYGGTLETFPLAPLVHVFGGSRLGLRLLPLIESLVLVGLCFLLARRLFGRRTAVYAAGVTFVFPLPFVVFGMREMMFYLPVTILGAVILLLAIAATDAPTRWGLWLTLGFAAGLGWWLSPQIILYVIPVAAWTIVRIRRAVIVPAALAFGGAVIGALPWLVYNARHGWVSLDPVAGSGSYFDHVRTFFSDGLPVALGLRSIGDGHDLTPLTFLLLGVFGVIVVSAFLNRNKRCAIHLWVLAMYPLLFALSPLAWWVGEARYYFYLWPVLAMTLVDGLRREWLRAAGLVAFSALTIVGLFDLTSYPPRQFTNVGPVGPLERTLADVGVNHVVAGYWTAYKLAYESDGRIVVSPTFADRQAQWSAEVDSSPRIAIVYAKNTLTRAEDTATMAQQRLSALGLSSRRIDLQDFVVVVPDGPVSKAQIGTDALPPVVS